MTRYEKMMGRLAAGERILIDGATGTEIERRGVPMLDDAWNGGGALSHPNILRQVHEDYLRVGAEIVISNTFATSRHALADAGEAAHFEAYNRRGVELAKEARDRAGRPDALVAGGISYWSWSGKHPALDTLRDGVTEQAGFMVDAGADLLMLEMMVDLERLMLTLEAARTSGLPVWVGLSCKADASGKMILWRGDPLDRVLGKLQDLDVPQVSIMHSEVEYVSGCLEVIEQNWAGPVGVYAHSARWVEHKCIFDDTISPAAYANYARSWLDRGAQMIGGCCGMGVNHIAALKQMMTLRK
ncbi:MAG: homocysteine S-methyltransferase family protein [Pseudomonadota bacterium]